MILETINLSTGPISLQPSVINALTEQPISHRSGEFKQIFNDLQGLLKYHYKINDVYLLSGSGTLANEVMIWQIKMLGTKGMILSNGEFGDRLVNQAGINNLDFLVYEKAWGEKFEADEIRKTIALNKPEWILFTHCETSTGVINDIDAISEIAVDYNIKCYVDCISTVGCMPIDLSRYSMATASSGKGLGSIAGLAVIFSNVLPVSNGTIPNYFDLEFYSKCSGIPFTISSNMISALYEGCCLKLAEESYRLIELYSSEINYLLQKFHLLPFDSYHVFTMQRKKNTAVDLAEEFKRNGLLASYESKYLIKRNWVQLALFSHYNNNQIDTTLISLKNTLERMYSGKSLTMYS